MGPGLFIIVSIYGIMFVVLDFLKMVRIFLFLLKWRHMQIRKTWVIQKYPGRDIKLRIEDGHGWKICPLGRIGLKLFKNED